MDKRSSRRICQQNISEAIMIEPKSFKPITKAQTKILQELKAIIARANPCKIEVVNGKPTCERTKHFDLHQQLHHCCEFEGKCKYAGPTGCTVVSSGCSFWFCRYAWENLSHNDKRAICALGKRWRGEMFMRYDEPIYKTQRPPFGEGLWTLTPRGASPQWM